LFALRSPVHRLLTMSTSLPWGRAIGQVLVTSALLAGLASLALRSSKAHGDDLVQDDVSARAWLDGESPYRPLGELRQRAGFPPVPGHVLVRHNPHPPGAVLLTVPFAGADFGTALTLVRGAQILALAIAWAVAYRLFAPPVPWWAWAAAGGVFGLWAPFWQGLDWGQPVGVLALAVAVLWALARAERPVAFGFVLGLACTVRPFFAILCVVAAGWPPRRALLAAGAAAVGGALPFALCRVWPWDWLRLATEAGGYVAEAGSAPGVLGLGTGGGVVLYAAAAVVLAYVRRRGLATDPTLALAATAAMLTYPLAWFQYDVSLIPVVAWVAVGAHRTGSRFAVWALVGYLALRAIPDVIPDPNGTGLVDAIGRAKGWVQLAARSLPLAAGVALARRPAVSASAPS